MPRANRHLRRRLLGRMHSGSKVRAYRSNFTAKNEALGSENIRFWNENSEVTATLAWSHSGPKPPAKTTRYSITFRTLRNGNSRQARETKENILPSAQIHLARLEGSTFHPLVVVERDIRQETKDTQLRL